MRMSTTRCKSVGSRDGRVSTRLSLEVDGTQTAVKPSWESLEGIKILKAANVLFTANKRKRNECRWTEEERMMSGRGSRNDREIVQQTNHGLSFTLNATAILQPNHNANVADVVQRSCCGGKVMNE